MPTPLSAPRLVAALALTPLAAPAAAAAQAPSQELAVELFAGSAWSLPLPLVIDLAGGGRAEFTAHYSTRPLADAPYYSSRVSRSGRERGGEVEMLHHKLYLDNPRPPVDRFEVTHGYNLPMANVARPAGGWRWRVGLGVVVAHPEGRIAGREVGPLRTVLGGGYHVAGIATQLAVGRRYALGRGAVALTAAPEAKLTAAVARVPIAGGGRVVVPNVALHALGGVGVRRRW